LCRGSGRAVLGSVDPAFAGLHTAFRSGEGVARLARSFRLVPSLLEPPRTRVVDPDFGRGLRHRTPAHRSRHPASGRPPSRPLPPRSFHSARRKSGSRAFRRPAAREPRPRRSHPRSTAELGPSSFTRPRETSRQRPACSRRCVAGPRPRIVLGTRRTSARAHGGAAERWPRPRSGVWRRGFVAARLPDVPAARPACARNSSRAGGPPPRSR
jgi:hypothetical protein